MNREKLQFILSSMDLRNLQGLVKEINAISNIEVMKPARTALVMMGVKDSVQLVPFYLGEVLISQCAVKVDGTIGYGFVMGDDLEKAYYLAVIEAAVTGNHPLVEEINKMVSKQATVQNKQNQLEYSLITKTKVRFDTMEETTNEPVD